jgi:phosphoserine phosphatase
MNHRNTAAFFRVEGILLSRGVLAASAYIAANAKKFGERALRLGLVALAAPMHTVLGQTDRALAHRLVHLAFRGMTEDRVAVLAEEYAEDILKDKLLDQGVELMKRAQGEGRRVVLLSDGIATIMQPFARHLRHFDELVCNHLEFRDGEATGRSSSRSSAAPRADAGCRTTPASTPSTSRTAAPTARTAPTCCCSPPSASPAPSTPTSCCAAAPATRTGRSSSTATSRDFLARTPRSVHVKAPLDPGHLRRPSGPAHRRLRLPRQGVAGDGAPPRPHRRQDLRAPAPQGAAHRPRPLRAHGRLLARLQAPARAPRPEHGRVHRQPRRGRRGRRLAPRLRHPPTPSRPPASTRTSTSSSTAPASSTSTPTCARP